MEEYKYILNGRVNLFDNKSSSTKILNNNPNLYVPEYTIKAGKLATGNCVSELYFSQKNIQIIQEGIINSVFNKTEGKFYIGKQNEQELMIIMRSIYFQHSKNLNYDIISQVKELNTLVINWSVDEIIKNIKQYVGFKKSVSTLPLPLEHSQLPSQKGTKTLEVKSFM